jgi:8-oxo-dGTP pyrophosphatase MutT (NUDIX family)
VSPRRSLQPQVTVAAVAEINGRFLMVEERIRGRVVFNQPAGRVEDGETLIAAVIRETREETAHHFEPRALLGIYLWRNPQTGYTVMRFAFRGDVVGARLEQALDTPIIAAHWLSAVEIRAREAQLRYPPVLRCLEDYESGKSLPLSTVAELDLTAAARLQAVKISA